MNDSNKLFRKKSGLFNGFSFTSFFGDFFHKRKAHSGAVEDLLDGDDLQAVESRVIFGFELSGFLCFQQHRFRRLVAHYHNSAGGALAFDGSTKLAHLFPADIARFDRNDHRQDFVLALSRVRNAVNSLVGTFLFVDNRPIFGIGEDRPLIKLLTNAVVLLVYQSIDRFYVLGK